VNIFYGSKYNPYYAGVFGIGKWTSTTMSNNFMPGSADGSVRVPAGVIAVFYSADGFTGNTITVRGP
jgi:hypothetical protein